MERSSPRARKKRSMGGGKNVHRNLYNEEFHYAELDIPEIVCVGIYIYTYIYRNIEQRASSTEIRSVYICLPLYSSLLPFTPCMNHDTPVSSPWDRFFVSLTSARSSLRRERNLALALRLARDREGETSRELNERSASGDRTMHNDE